MLTKVVSVSLLLLHFPVICSYGGRRAADDLRRATSICDAMKSSSLPCNANYGATGALVQNSEQEW